MVMIICLFSCGFNLENESKQSDRQVIYEESGINQETETKEQLSSEIRNDTVNEDEKTTSKIEESILETEDITEIESESNKEDLISKFSFSDVPEYEGVIFAEINNNKPFFTESHDAGYKEFSDFDKLGRTGRVWATVGCDTMPTEKRGEIGQIKPSGWHTIKYPELIEDRYLYNRCHLLGYQLSGENANEKNLITGTRYFNVEGMLPFENEIADYIEDTYNHVNYRVTPIYNGDELVARGVLMEASSIEDYGVSLEFCVFVYNVQPYIEIDYLTGDSSPNEEGEAIIAKSNKETNNGKGGDNTGNDNNTEEIHDYVLNTNTHKFHYPDCRSVGQMAEHNKKYFTGTRHEVIDMGYDPCGNCHP